MAREWARAGRDLALCARRTEELERLRDELVREQPGITVSVHRLDVTDHDAVLAVVDDAVAALGGLDRVVANAGVATGGSIGTGHAESNRATLTTNVLGTLNQAEAAVAHFRRVGSGHLAIISSMSSLRGIGGSMNAYSASKAALATLAEGLRSDLWGSGVTVYSIHPGYIRTDMVGHFSRPLLTAGLERGTRAIVRAIEQERARAYVPALPWAALAVPMKLVPLGLFRRVAG